jgi:hypothetical protein
VPTAGRGTPVASSPQLQLPHAPNNARPPNHLARSSVGMAFDREGEGGKGKERRAAAATDVSTAGCAGSSDSVLASPLVCMCWRKKERDGLSQIVILLLGILDGKCCGVACFPSSLLVTDLLQLPHYLAPMSLITQRRRCASRCARWRWVAGPAAMATHRL